MNMNMDSGSNRRSGTLLLVIGLHVLGLCGLLFSAHAARKVAPLPKLMWMVAVSAPQTTKPEPKPVPIKPSVSRQPAVTSPVRPVRVASPIPAVNSEPFSPLQTASNVVAEVPSNVAAPPAAPAPPAPATPAPSAPSAPLTPPQFNAAYLNNPLPVYPPLLRRAGEQGRVILRVLVNVDGSAGEVRVQNSSGSALFDESAQAAVRKWRFVPARRGDAVVAEWVQVPIDFKLS